ncbi:IS3 family transposase [Ferrimicrobium sp.]|uniref:IS3 family transposase n=1 Tax=Ferrimicrobium sp. TaxID=2926050 RepID=UPI00261410BE|nr:IS3 family transposase [Ferrimicrobium sp.]
MVEGVGELTEIIGLVAACECLGIARSSYYYLVDPPVREPKPKRPSPRRLSDAEREHILEVCHSERFCDVSVREIYATLLDEGIYLASVPTIYRILAEAGETRERRRQATHPARVKPELLATGPGQVWSWDISKLKGPTKGIYYQLYVIIDIYSRSIVGWRIEDHESSDLAQELMGEAIAREEVDPNQLTIHADNGASMASHSVAEFLANLGVQKSHSRPHTSNDNPFSEAQFKTLKYRGDFPERFGSLEEARSFFQRFFTWYQYEHHHAGLGLMTPADVHEGYAEVITERRAEVLRDAYEVHPERFVRKIPTPPTLNNEVWINRPSEEEMKEGP